MSSSPSPGLHEKGTNKAFFIKKKKEEMRDESPFMYFNKIILELPCLVCYLVLRTANFLCLCFTKQTFRRV